MLNVVPTNWLGAGVWGVGGRGIEENCPLPVPMLCLPSKKGKLAEGGVWETGRCGIEQTRTSLSRTSHCCVFRPPLLIFLTGVSFTFVRKMP